MQAVKDKLNDMSAMRKAKAEAKAGEKAEKEIAKARVDVAHEVRLAREAEAAMDLHVAKAGERVEKEMAKHPEPHLTEQPNAATAGGTTDHSGHYPDSHGATAMPGANYHTNATGAPPTTNATGAPPTTNDSL